MLYLRGWIALCMGLANQLIMSLVVLLICVNNYCKILKEENSSVVVCNNCLVICFDHTVIKRFNITIYKQPYVTRLTRRVPLVEKELLILPGHLSSTPGFSWGSCYCSSSIYAFWLPLWYLQPLLTLYTSRTSNSHYSTFTITLYICTITPFPINETPFLVKLLCYTNVGENNLTHERERSHNWNNWIEAYFSSFQGPSICMAVGSAQININHYKNHLVTLKQICVSSFDKKDLSRQTFVKQV